MTVTVRFAPSPTGKIHIGNARTALFNWLFAQKNGGRFIQRFDDTDTARSTPEFARSILYDLHWLGLFPDLVYNQSERFDIYASAAEALKDAGVLYPCYETSEELELKRKIRLSRRQPPVYGRESLRQTPDQHAEFEARGLKPHWRFLLPNFDEDPFDIVRTDVTWTDIIRGEETVDLSSLSDPVLVREDGTYLYTLPSVVDDIAMGITHVIRGGDHVTNTGVQIALTRVLGATPPHYGHHNLLTTTTGEGLSKRTGALSIEGLRNLGLEPMAVASLAVLLGTSENVAAVPSMSELCDRFDLGSTSKSASKFDPAELVTLNRTLLQAMDFAEARDRLAVLSISGPKAEPFWLAVRGNVDTLDDAGMWWRILHEGPGVQPEFDPDDLEFLRDAFDLLPQEPWDKTTWKFWTGAVKDATGRKGKALFMPIRLALTGLPSGPELADLLPLLDRAGTLARRP